MCRQWQDDLVELVAQVQQDRAQLSGIVLASAKTSFLPVPT
jgi:3-hydroxyacyl-CoA dehydrogenase/enoyl-CoA hydratase/3-hydroxybutyryl-CoA epimerase